MSPINFPEANQLLGRPADMTDEECRPLPICRAVLHGYPHTICLLDGVKA